MPPLVIGAVALGGAAIAAGGVAAAFAAGGLTAFAANFGASMLLSGAAQALMPQPTITMPGGGQLEMKARTVTVREPVRPRELVYGRTRKGGTIVFLHSTGEKDETLHLVIALAGHQVQSIGAVYFDGEMAVDAAGVAQGRWSGLIYVEKRLGRRDQTAFEGLVSAAPDLWTSAHRLRGCAAVYLRLTYERDAFPGGIPNILVDLEGKADIYDPRSDTRGYSENPALCLADYMADPTYGLGASIGAEDGVETTSLIEAANICEELTPAPAPNGGITQERRYSCNGVVSLSQEPKTIIEAMLTAMAGRCIWQAGQWRIRAGAHRIAVDELGPDDVAEGGISLVTRQSRSDNFNAVRGQFVSPENDWQPDDFPAYASDVYLAEDGGERVWQDINLPFTISASTAQRLAKIELERNRRQQVMRLRGKLKAWRVATGETVGVTHPHWGFAAKPFEVERVRLDLASAQDAPRLVPELVLRETSPLIYSWTADEARIYAAAPRTRLPSRFDIAAPGRPSGEEELYVTRDGSAVKVLLRVRWLAAPSAFVDHYRFEARLGGGEWQDYGRVSGLMMELRDIAPGFWEFRVRAVSALGVSSVWMSNTLEVAGLSAPPQELSGLTIQSAGGLAILKWDPAPDVDVRVGGSVIIRHSKGVDVSWANSTVMDRVSGGESIAVVPLKPGTYLLRAQDSEGRQGPVNMVTTKGVQILTFAQLNTLAADPFFTGAKTGLEVGVGTLSLQTGLDGDGRPIVSEPEGLYQFSDRLDFGALRRVRLRSEILVGAEAVSDLIDDRVALIDTWADFDGSEGAEIDVVLEVRETDDDPSDPAAVWGPWGRIDNSEVEARAVEARAWLRTLDPAFNPIVSELRLIADAVA